MKDWYDGYHFGEFDMYCPWDVMNYLRDLRHQSEGKTDQLLEKYQWK